MVTKKRARQPFRPATRDVDGSWLCNVVDGCTSVAVMQASTEALPPCAGCDIAGAEMKRSLEQRRAELAAVDSREGAIKAAMKSREDDPPNEPLDFLNQLELRAIAERRRILGGEIDGLAAEHARVADEHTHPLFACDKHATKLPK